MIYTTHAEYGAVLAELMASREVGLAYRQLASVLLRQYLDSHWSRLADKFTEPVPEEKVCGCAGCSWRGR